MRIEKIIKILDYIIEGALYGLALFVPISIAGIGILSVLAIIAFLIKKILCPDFQFIKNNKLAYIALLVFVLFMAASLFNSGPYLVKGFRALFGKWIQYILIFIIAADHLQNPRRLKNILTLMLATLGLVVLSGYSQRFFGFEFLRNGFVDTSSGAVAEVTSAFKNRNSFAAYLVCLLPLALSASLVKTSQKFCQLFLYAFALFCAGALLLTFSRGGWLGFLIGGLFMVGTFKKKLPIVLFLSFFLAGIFLVPSLRHRAACAFESKTIHTATDGSLESSPRFFVFQPQSPEGRRFAGEPVREAIWQGAVVMIQENPFLGKGLGTFMDYLPRYTEDIGIFYTHNCYLQIWAESGVFSLAFFLCFVGMVLWQTGRTALAHQREILGLILAGLHAGLCGFLVHSFFDVQLYSIQLKALFWLMLGLVMAAHSLLKEQRMSPCHP